MWRGAQERVGEGVEVLAADRRQVHQARPGVGLAPLGHVGAAVHRHLVPARAEALGQVLHGGLEAAVGGGDAAGAEHRDPHATASATAAHAARAHGLLACSAPPARARPRAAARPSRGPAPGAGRPGCRGRWAPPGSAASPATSGMAPRARGHHGASAGHRLDHRQAEALVQRRVRGHRGGAVEVGELLVVEVPEPPPAGLGGDPVAPGAGLAHQGQLQAACRAAPAPPPPGRPGSCAAPGRPPPGSSAPGRDGRAPARPRPRRA